MHTIDTMQTRHTDAFTIQFQALEEYDLDLSFDEDGSIREALDCGELVAFCAAVFVYYKGAEIGSSFLGNCIYRDPREFLKSGYLTGMLEEACNEARAHFQSTPKLRKPKRY